MLPPADMQIKENSVVQKREFGKVVRATNKSPKLGKLWVWSPIRSNCFLYGHSPKPTIYWVWGPICAFRGLFPRQTRQNMFISTPPSSRLRHKWVCRDLKHFRAKEEIMFLGLSENLKSRERIFTTTPSSILHPCGHFPGAEARLFAKTSDQKKGTHRNDQAPNPINFGFGGKSANKFVPW